MDFRFAERGDAALILRFIRELADYEHMLGEVVATPELLEEWLFDKKKAEVVFVLADGEEVGFALFFHNFSGFIAALLYSFCVTMLFVTCAPQLVGVFTPASSGLDYAGVRAYALPMLRLCGLYLMTDAVLLVSSGVLRGAGDTFWCMVVHLAINLTNAACIVFSVRVLQVKPLQAWTIFVVFGILGSTAIFTRYRLGHWKKLRIIEGGATTGA